MIRQVQFDKNGVPSCICAATATLPDYVEVPPLFINLPEEDLLSRLLNTEGTISLRDPRPTIHHIWVNGEWVKDVAAADAAARQEYKSQRAVAVSSIKVTTSTGKTFDGDEASQERMARAVLFGLEGETILWTMADNIKKEVTKAELIEAGRLAGLAQSEIW